MMLLQWIRNSLNWLETKLIDDWRTCYRYWSVRLNAALLAVMAFFAVTPMMPPQVQAALPPTLQLKIAGVWVMLNLIARLIKQKPNP